MATPAASGSPSGPEGTGISNAGRQDGDGIVRRRVFDPDWKLVDPGVAFQLFERVRINEGAGKVNFDAEAVRKAAGALHNGVQPLKA